MSFAGVEVDSAVAAVVEDTPLTTDHAHSQPLEAAEPAQPLLRVSLLFAGHPMAYLVQSACCGACH